MACADPERWRQIEDLFHAALEHAPDGRAAFLDAACAQNHGLRQEVESLIAQSGQAEGFLETQAHDATATIAAGSLSSGTQFGPYRIVSLLGAGGMGEVYRAHDSKLGRDVAIKTLPREFVGNPERLARFRREARTLASLNHPNIAAIYGIEESDGATFLVLELVEGPCLSGPLPVEKAIDCARQVAEALEAAHAKGIIHRDLKPANIKVTPQGRVKVLDFGLAKAIRATEEKMDPTQQRTMTALETMEGQISGTPPYMSPEQARGHPVDQRTDIWAFGCLLYELLSGKRAFRGDTLIETIGMVLEREPDWAALPANTPAKVRELLQRCLEKDVTRRVQSIEEARRVFEDAQRKRSRWVPVAAAMAALALGAAAGMAYLVVRSREASAPQIVSVAQVSDLPLEEYFPSFSPDGKSVVYQHWDFTNGWEIYLQRIGGSPINLSRPTMLNGTTPAFSPDGELIVFAGGGAPARKGAIASARAGLYLMGATGESIRRIGDSCSNPSWSPDGREIVCSTGYVLYEGAPSTSQLWRVDVSTGAKRVIGKPGAIQPDWSPHNLRIAYGSVEGNKRTIWTLPLDGGEPAPVTDDAFRNFGPRWAPDGKSLYFASDRGGSMNLWRVAIDERSGRVRGAPQSLATPATYLAHISVSHDGKRIAYSQQTQDSQIYKVPFDPRSETVHGTPIALTSGTRRHLAPDPSPDGNWLTFTTEQKTISVMSTDGTGIRQLTNGAFRDVGPRWSPDNRRIAFVSNRSGRNEIWLINADGSELHQITTGAGLGEDSFRVPFAWSPDAKRIAYSRVGKDGIIIEVDRPLQDPQPVSIAPYRDPAVTPKVATWSPDGRRLGMTTDGKGTFIYELATQTYTQISKGEERRPMWLQDSRHVILESVNDVNVVDTVTGRSKLLFSIAPRYTSAGSISPDNRTIYLTGWSPEADIWIATLK